MIASEGKTECPNQKGEVNIGQFLPPDGVRLGAGAREGGVDSALEPFLGVAAAGGKEGACGEGRGSLRASQVSRPQFYDPGKQEPHCFSPSVHRSLSWGSWMAMKRMESYHQDRPAQELP